MHGIKTRWPRQGRKLITNGERSAPNLVKRHSTTEVKLTEQPANIQKASERNTWVPTVAGDAGASGVGVRRSLFEWPGWMGWEERLGARCLDFSAARLARRISLSSKTWPTFFTNRRVYQRGNLHGHFCSRSNIFRSTDRRASAKVDQNNLVSNHLHQASQNFS